MLVIYERKCVDYCYCVCIIDNLLWKRQLGKGEVGMKIRELDPVKNSKLFTTSNHSCYQPDVNIPLLILHSKKLMMSFFHERFSLLS